MTGRLDETDPTDAVLKRWNETLEHPRQDPRQSIRATTVALPPEDSGAAERTAALGRNEPDRKRSPSTVGPGHRRIAIGVSPEDGEVLEYEVLAEIGAGGMGTVVRARQRSLERQVAIKRLRAPEGLPDAAAHFDSEALVCAVLDHPNIVPVHDMGEDREGNPFYAMKLIEGRPWVELLDARGEPPAPGEEPPRDLRAHLDILLEVCNAIAFAHSRGFVHRDVKPHNVMVGRFGEVLVVDWGLAVSLRPPSSPRIFDLSRVLVTCGTPAYMAPEIAAGHRERIGTWTDVYMLGATAFEVLYGRPPHDDATAALAIKTAAKNEWKVPDPIPSEVQPFHELLLPIVRKALSTDPRDRYPDASAFGDAIRAALRHLEAVEIATAAARELDAIEANEPISNQAPTTGSAVRDGYRSLARIIAVLEQTASTWQDHPLAPRHLVRAHLLHAEVSVRVGDLTLAKTHLQSVDRAIGTLDADLELRRQAAWRHLESRTKAEERRRRRTIGLQYSAVGLAILLLLGALGSAAIIKSGRDQARAERNHLSKLLLMSVGDRLDADLRELFSPVPTILAHGSNWTRNAEAGGASEAFVRVALEMIDDIEVVQSVVRADDRGHETMLLRTPEGWQVRRFAPDGPAEFQRLAPDGSLLATWSDEIEYHPHQRPWYRGALELEPGQRIHWTRPYTFFTSREPGITASTVVVSGDRTHVIGVDVSLASISDFTQSARGYDHGRVVVLTEDDRLIGLPRAPSLLRSEDRERAMLGPGAEVDDPITARAIVMWQDQGRSDRQPFWFDVAGRPWWGSFRRFDLDASERLWIGVALPESDFDLP